MSQVLEILIKASEKAARVAKSCCENSIDKTLLITEKCEGEANTRFDKDFKTIADVLAQESAKALIVSRFPELATHVRGEECSEIQGVNIGLQADVEKTSDLLSCVIPSITAERMAKAAHSEIKLEIEVPAYLPDIDLNDLGVWIDPIDGTAEFIAGVTGQAEPGHGLPCVTVLIGAYLRSTGEPVVGVINQPFFDGGKGRVIWGFHHANVNKWSEQEINTCEKIALMSSAEKAEVIDKFHKSGWQVKSVPGAGHKLMKVALGEASAYIVSQGTTFRWDTCAPHAIILARGGNVLNYKDYTTLTYNDETDLETKEYCNKDGIIAYCDQSVLNELKTILE